MRERIGSLTEEVAREHVVSLLEDLTAEQALEAAARRRIHGISMIIDGYADVFPALREMIPDGALQLPTESVAKRVRRSRPPRCRVSAHHPLADRSAPPLRCSLPEKHEGPHRDATTGNEWAG